ncbi:MarR family winged helix-turn-helix transcriptional regulator [Lentzea nigeriaca]|uniref:MarR family winged helix-turn-helix transcriptional regulator n=1 Tax=Lentzea nigeriaca TaxID=1128665 RepID=UPI001957CF29|nr:MarR family transcriptional regulator [Lentzea nigeriaca]MBM7858743.1 DNA-binding MarR family transcriptional regulator [Lentzea nigeriaca]
MGKVEHVRPSLMYEIKQVELAVRALMDEVLRPAGVTTLQYTALTVLARRDGLTSAELARNSFVTAQTMTDMVAALERRELIVRTPDPAHGRRLLISLTDSGRAFLEEHAAEVTAIEKRMVSNLSKGERTALHDMLNRCRAALAGS